MGCVIAFHNPSQMSTKTLFEDFGGDLDMDTRKNLMELLKSERYSKLCFCLQYPFQVVSRNSICFIIGLILFIILKSLIKNGC